ncbi:MAG: hypothetical protein K5757_04935, partial [Bacteroidaceae bacterium]|nr:hypothetical protein [Bacteroidaceae bacterium]
LRHATQPHEIVQNWWTAPATSLSWLQRYNKYDNTGKKKGNLTIENILRRYLVTNQVLNLMC